MSKLEQLKKRIDANTNPPRRSDCFIGNKVSIIITDNPNQPDINVFDDKPKKGKKGKYLKDWE